MTQSQIIFAPYNYVIDPSIRHTMGINLENSALLVDEAHNILQVARDAASISLNQYDIKENALMYHNYFASICKDNKRRHRKRDIQIDVL